MSNASRGDIFIFTGTSGIYNFCCGVVFNSSSQSPAFGRCYYNGFNGAIMSAYEGTKLLFDYNTSVNSIDVGTITGLWIHFN